MELGTITQEYSWFTKPLLPGLEKSFTRGVSADCLSPITAVAVEDKFSLRMSKIGPVGYTL